jgi:hypothetical protein
MIKRFIALFLSFVMLINVTPSIVASFANDSDINTTIQESNAYNGDIFDLNLLMNSNVSVDEIENHLLNTGEQRFSSNRLYKLNSYVYQKYKIVAYTDEASINGKQAGLTSMGNSMEITQTSDAGGKKKFYEYRYLGYDVNGRELITNDFYPADSKTVSDAKKRKWIYNDPKLWSWSEKVLTNPNMLHYYLKSNVQNDDEKSGVYKDKPYSIADITHVTDIDTLVKFPKVMGNVSFSSPGMLKMVHLSGGSRWYDTMRVKAFDYRVKTSIENVEKDVKLPAGTETYDITYDVVTTIPSDKLKTDGLSKDGRYFTSIELQGVEPMIFVNDDMDNIDLPSLKKTGLVKTIDLKGIKVNDEKSFGIEATSIVNTFDGGVKTSKATETIKITLVANDAVDFIIKNKETDITGASVTVKKLDFSLPLTVTLEDSSLVQSGDVTARDWYINTPTGWKHFKGGNEETVDYTLNTANRNYLIEGKVKFKLVVSTADGVVDYSEQYFIPIEKEEGPSGGVVAVLTSSPDFNEKKDYYEVMEGQIFTLRGNKSYHTADLKITDYDFDVGEDFDEGIKVGGSKKSSRAFYPNSDGGSIYRAYLTVTDEVGATDTTYIRTKVHPAEFSPEIAIYGSFKENRKLSFLVSNTHNLTYYPIKESGLNWTITPLDGQGDVVRIDGSLKGSTSFDALFKKSGRYKVHVEGCIESNYNDKLYYGETERIINIAEDLPPVADFAVPKTVVRDIKNGLMTKLYAQDLSKDNDGDIIVQRIWSYKFDSDNDGDFEDESSVVFHAGNEEVVYFKSDHVGKYKFELKVKEAFGQPTIAKFIDDSDKKRGTTDDKKSEDKITDLSNRAPTVELELSQHKNIDLIVYEDLETADKVNLESTLTELETSLLEKKLNLTTHFLSPTENVGSRDVWTTYYDTYIKVGIHVKGQDEDRNDIDYVDQMNFLLDSYSSENNEKMTGYKDLNRFEIVEVKWGKFGSEKYKYKGRTLDYSEYDWRELIVVYKEYGVQKSKTYKFVYDYEYSSERKYDVYVDGYDYDSYDIVGTKLIVDEPSRDREDFVITNNTFEYRAPSKPKVDIPRNVKRKVVVKTYDDLALNDILSKCQKDDTFFLNLASKEENRIALNKTLTEKLKENNIHYMTIDDYDLPLNPITGKCDETFVDNNGDFYITVNNIIYKLLLKARYYNYREELTIEKVPYTQAENKNWAIDVPTFMNKYSTTAYSIYTTGWKDWYGTNYTMKYGLDALNGDMYDYNNDDYEYIESTSRDVVREAWNDPDLAKKAIGKDLHLSVEKDGTLVGQSYRVQAEYYTRYNYIRVHYKYVSLGSGYLGVTKFEVDAEDDYSAKGLIHSNGNIYFRKPVSWHVRYGVSWRNYLIINDGISNIEHIYYNKTQNKIYVETKEKKLYTYDGATGKKKLLLNSFKERVGDSYKIEDGKWMIDGKIYNYKEVFTNDKNPYFRWLGGSTYSYATSMFYINDQDEFRIRRKEYKRGSVIREYDYLIGKDVKTIIVKGMEDKYTLNFHETSVNAFRNPHIQVFETNDGKFYQMRNHSWIASWRDPDSYYERYPSHEIKGHPKNLQFLGNWSYYDGHHSFSYQLYAEELEKGLGIRETLNTYPKSLAYATLTKGKASDCIGDGALTTISTLSKSYASLNNLKNGIVDIYKNYSTTDTMHIILGETINTAMIMQDYENDPAYSMNIYTSHIDPNYYENSMGLDPNSGQKNITKFDYVGVYESVAKVRDNPIGEDDRFDNYRLWNQDDTKVKVFVHRRPVAKMNYSLIEVDDSYQLKAWDKNSYDLDHESQENKGIISWKWSLKAKDEVNWIRHEGKEFNYNTIESGKIYDLVYQVQDEEGAWSEQVHKELNPEIIPIEIDASVQSADTRFGVDELPITEYYELYDIVSCYPKAVRLSYGLYDGDRLLSSLMTLTQEEGVTGSFKSEEDRKLGRFTWHNQFLQVPRSLADGQYTIRVTATAINKVSKSESCLLAVGVRTPIKPEPSMDDLWMTGESYIISCNTSIYTDQVEATLFEGTAKEDKVTLGLKEILTEEIEGQIKQVKKVWTYTYDVAEDLPDSLYNVRFTGQVNTSPIKTESKVEQVQVISLKFDEVILTGAWNHWRGQIDLFGKRMDDMPLRFLSWEKIYFTAKTLGNPEEVYITMSPELQAMSFTDKNGTVFNYKDDFGYEVTFPLALKEIEENVWMGEYILPLAHSTLSWEDRRLKPSYEIIVTAKKNGKTVSYDFNEREDRGIEITGNVTNLIYTQPMPDRRK